MSKNSRQKTERRHKREQKKKRRAQQQKQIRPMMGQASPDSFDKSAWSALQPPTNTVSPVKPKPVLDPNQGFDPQKWKPDEENS